MQKQYDVIVAGGGTAGMLAAVAAARNGAKTLVVERWGFLGGTATYGIPFLGMFDGNGKQANGGLAQELVDRMVANDGSPGHVHGAYWKRKPGESDYAFTLTPFDPEILKYVAQEMMAEAGAEMLFHTFVSDVIMEGQKLSGIEVVNKSGKQKIMAKAVIDTTGDADIAALAGVPTRKGLNGIVQNVSILFRLGNVNMEGFVEAVKKGEKVKGWGEWHTRLAEAKTPDGKQTHYAHVAGHMMPYEDGCEGEPVTFTAVSPRDGEVYLNITRITGIDGTNAEDLSKAEIMERRNVVAMSRAIIKNVPGFEKAYLASTAPIGIRESRNIVGDYTLTEEDVVNCREFEDGVARGAYPIDIHDPAGGKTMFTFLKDCGSYSIPYRCFLPLNVDNLLVAGRCISATHEAIGTARMMGAVLSHGQAVGTAAALAVAQGVSPRQVDVKLVREKLKEQGAIL